MPFESGVIPKISEGYDIPEEVTESDLLIKQIELLEKQIEQKDYELHRQEEFIQFQDDEYTLLHNDNSLIVEKLETLIELSSTGDSNLGESNAQMIQKLDELNHSISVGSNTVLTYGVLYIPLAIIVFLLWRFFSAFLRPLR